MSQICQFTPNSEISAQQNLREFIALARDSLTLWSDLEGFTWDAYTWPTTLDTVRFTKYECRNMRQRKIIESHQMMHPAFIEVAKSYLRYSNTVRPRRRAADPMRALRVIEYVLRKDMKIPDITKFGERHWEEVIRTINNEITRDKIAYETLIILKQLADFFILTVDARFWSTPYVGEESYNSLNGTKAPSEARSKKIPDQDALLAIAEIFSRGANEEQNHTDLMVSCITALLLSAPMRIGETLRLRTDCLREDIDKNGESQHYLAYWVPKTRDFARKAIPKTMAAIAIDAIKRLSDITEESRRLARYMETIPEHFYRHPNCPDIPDDVELSCDQVVQALGLTKRGSCGMFMKRYTGRHSLAGYTLDSLWQIVLKAHRDYNPHFPYQETPNDLTQPPLRMSESLMCFRRFQLAWTFTTSPILLTPYDNCTYGKYLATGSKVAEDKNFFRRNGYNTNKLKSHSLRHLLNRLGRSSGISVEMLTEWSSRASTQQTRTYLHDNPAESASKGAALLGTTQEQEPRRPVTNEEEQLYGQGPFHRSRYGICRRSWRAGPCNKFADCLNCSELLMCKGDKIAADIIKLDRDNLVQTYTAAQRAIAEGERAASRWTEKAGPQIDRLDSLLAILHNPEIPDGSPIEIAGEDFNHENVIVSEKADAAGVKLLDRSELRISYGDDLLACLDLLRSSDNA